MKFKILSALMSIALLSAMPVHAADDEVKTDIQTDLIYSIEENHIVIRGAAKSPFFTSELVIPDTIEDLPVTEINKNAFKYDSRFESVIFPDTLETIGENAFYYSNNLKSIDIPEHVTTIGTGAFTGVHFETITIDENNPAFAVNDNILYNKDLTEFVLIPYSITEVNIPDTITEIPDYTFDYHKELTSVTLPEGLISIGKDAFRQTGISEITIPSTVTEIGNGAFDFCPNLESLTFAEGMEIIPSNLTEIETIYCGAIDENGNPYGWSEFSYEYYGGFMRSYALRKVYLPSTLEFVEENVFGCNGYYYHQFDVFYNGTREDWQNVRVSDNDSATLEKGGNEAILTANMHFLPSSDAVIDGDVTLDNEVTVLDFVLLRKYLLNQNTLSEYEVIRADFNHDGQINIFDLLLLKKNLIS